MRFHREDPTARLIRLTGWHRVFIIWPRCVHHNYSTGVNTWAFLEFAERRGARQSCKGREYWVWIYQMVIPESPTNSEAVDG